MGYIVSNRCVLPNNKLGFNYRYPDLYNKKILCSFCYDKHNKNIIYRKTDTEKENDLTHITKEHLILDQFII